MRLAALIASLCLMVLPGLARAEAAGETTGLAPLHTLDAGRGWEGVGKLDLGGGSFCTAALIAPDQVLTAAHCLFDSDTGRQMDPAGISFLAGLRDGRAESYRGVRRAVVHADYRFSGPRTAGNVPHDLALLELDRPIRDTRVLPLRAAGSAFAGDEIGVVSYARDRAEAPALQETCRVLTAQAGMLVTSCTVDFGASGAPVFVIEGGVPRIVSVISAKADVAGREVALGAPVAPALEGLRAQLLAGGGVYQPDAPRIRRLGMSGETGGARGAGGAKFIRP